MVKHFLVTDNDSDPSGETLRVAVWADDYEAVIARAEAAEKLLREYRDANAALMLHQIFGDPGMAASTPFLDALREISDRVEALVGPYLPPPAGGGEMTGE